MRRGAGLGSGCRAALLALAKRCGALLVNRLICVLKPQSLLFGESEGSIGSSSAPRDLFSTAKLLQSGFGLMASCAFSRCPACWEPGEGCWLSSDGGSLER